MGFLVQLTGARRALEVGTFTGYSALWVAQALPSDGQLVCCDVSEEWTSVGRRHWQAGGVNDRIDLALAVDADGVHLGQDDLPTEVARSLMGNERLIGRSTHCLAHLQRAESEGVDYLGVGPVNATPTKPNRQPVGLSYVEEAAQKASLPWFAIGGIDSSTLGDVRQAGAQRVAVVTAVIKASDPGAASRELMAGLPCK